MHHCDAFALARTSTNRQQQYRSKPGETPWIESNSRALPKMSFKVFGIGEVLWDLLPTGPQLGGAPANVIYHAHHLGADASLITRIGNDGPGKEVLQQFRQKHLSAALIQIDEQHPTSTVDVIFPSRGMPEYTIHENVAWDHLVATQQAVMALSHAAAICFGSLSQRTPTSHAAVQTLLHAAPESALRVFDINLRQAFFTPETIRSSLQRANVLKLNTDEMDVLADLFQIKGTLEQKIMALAQEYGLHTIALTRGSEGSLLYHRGNWSIEQPRCIDIADTIGAGDAFTAALIVGLLHGLEPAAVHGSAAEISGYVCSQEGGMPLLPATFRTRITAAR